MEIIPLNPAFLRRAITGSARLQKYDFHFLESVDSTNDFLDRQLKKSPRHLLVIARRQTAGRGCFNRRWTSNIPDNIYLSLGFPQLPEIPQLQSFSIKYAAAIGKIFTEHLAIPLQVKPPNDLLLSGKKVAGILLESRQKTHSYMVGIGMNLQGAPLIQSQCDQPIGALEEMRRPLDSNRIALLLAEIADRIGEGISPPAGRREPGDWYGSAVPPSSIPQSDGGWPNRHRLP